MGTIQHHAIIATTWSEERASKVAATCAERGYGVVHTVSDVNGYHTLYMPTDGSKEGWEDSDAGDDRRNGFIDLVREDFDWIEVTYGERGQGVTRGNCGEDEEPEPGPRVVESATGKLDAPHRLIESWPA